MILLPFLKNNYLNWEFLNLGLFQLTDEAEGVEVVPLQVESCQFLVGEQAADLVDLVELQANLS